MTLPHQAEEGDQLEDALICSLYIIDTALPLICHIIDQADIDALLDEEGEDASCQQGLDCEGRKLTLQREDEAEELRLELERCQHKLPDFFLSFHCLEVAHDVVEAREIGELHSDLE